MYSIKPGRGPSIMGSIAGLVIGVPFLIFWITTASNHGAPAFMVFFGVAALLLLLASVFVGFYNATSKNRISEFDITTEKEESDPFERLVRGSDSESSGSKPREVWSTGSARKFCPSCGAELHDDFKFCPKCGKAQAGV